MFNDNTVGISVFDALACHIVVFGIFFRNQDVLDLCGIADAEDEAVGKRAALAEEGVAFVSQFNSHAGVVVYQRYIRVETGGTQRVVACSRSAEAEFHITVACGTFIDGIERLFGIGCPQLRYTCRHEFRGIGTHFVGGISLFVEDDTRAVGLALLAASKCDVHQQAVGVND